MARYTSLVFCALILLNGTLAANAETSVNIARVFFIPFGVRTYASVTRGDIESKSFLRILLVAENGAKDLHPLARKLQSLLELHPVGRRLDENFIRIKIEVPRETYYVDASGVVLRQSSGQTFQLGKLEKKQTEELIESLQGVIDAKAVMRVDSAKLR
jgi:hypothetical protein